MTDYLKAEVEFLRRVCWHVLLLFLIAVLVRSAGSYGNPSAIGGIPFQVNNVLFVLTAPLYSLLVQFIAYIESTNLFTSRLAIATEMVPFRSTFRVQVYGSIPLLILPAASCVFFILQFFTMVAPQEKGCIAPWRSHFSGSYGGPSIYCLRNVTDGNPWIYLPTYDLVMLVIGIACIVLSAACVWRWLTGR